MNRHQRRAEKAKEARRSRFRDEAVSYLAASGGEITEAERAVVTRLVRVARTLRLQGVPFYHGGHSGREVGHLLRPSAETGIVRMPGLNVHDRVFITTSLRTARSYAEQAGGVVYRVEPLGELDVDIICVRALMVLERRRRQTDSAQNAFLNMMTQFRCEAARVVAVLEEAE